jgi:histidinol-phosphate aminotransferase
MMDITALARPEIVAMKPYASARSSMSAEGILLNANEAPQALLDSPELRGLAINRYPPPQPAALKNRLSALYRVAEEQLLITRGSDEGIDLLTRVFCRAGEDAVLETTPCFGMYRVSAAIQGAAIIAVPRRAEQDFQVDVDALCSAIARDPRIRLVFLTSPNNPTGDCLPNGALERVLSAAEGQALVVLDEAYIEFSDHDSAAPKVASYPQLVVLRTLSKAWAAAGLRCGTVIANPVVIDLLGRIMAPYPLASPAIAAVMRVTDEGTRRRQREAVGQIMRQKRQLLRFLESTPWVNDLWPGEANFILARVDDAAGLTDWCGRDQIRIRNFDGQPLLDGCVRFSIGTGAEMQALIESLRKYGAQV